MANLSKPLVMLSIIAFVLAVLVNYVGPIMGVTAEGLSRASSNLALIGIALFFVFKRESSAS